MTESIGEAIRTMVHRQAALDTYRQRAEACICQKDQRHHGSIAADLLHGSVVRGGSPGFSSIARWEIERTVAGTPAGPEPFVREIVSLRAFAYLMWLRRLFMEAHPWLQIEVKVREIDPGSKAEES